MFKFLNSYAKAGPIVPSDDSSDQLNGEPEQEANQEVDKDLEEGQNDDDSHE